MANTIPLSGKNVSHSIIWMANILFAVVLFGIITKKKTTSSAKYFHYCKYFIFTC